MDTAEAVLSRSCSLQRCRCIVGLGMISDPQSPRPVPHKRPVDIHVHIVGNGAGGTGCWLRVSAWRRPFAELMLRHAHLPRKALHGNLDRLYVERLLEMVRGSSLGAVVIL